VGKKRKRRKRRNKGKGIPWGNKLFTRSVLGGLYLIEPPKTVERNRSPQQKKIEGEKFLKKEANTAFAVLVVLF